MVVVFCLFFAWFVFYVPNYLGHADNYIPANPGVTPTHIVPEWYYLPFYAILRAIPNKLARRGRDVRLDPDARLPAVARHLAGEVGDLSPALQAVLLGVRAGVPRARLARLEAGRRRLRDRGAHPHRLLLHPLPDHLPAARPDRDAEAAAEFDLGSRAEEGEGRRRSLLAARRSAPRAARRTWSSALAAAEAPHPPRNKWSFAGAFGKFDQGAAAARLQGLQGSLPDLPRAEPAVVPQPRRSGRPGLLGRAGAARSPPNTRCRTGRTTRARCSSATGGSPTASRRRRPGRTRRRRARSTTARCRPTCRCSPRRAATSAASPGS